MLMNRVKLVSCAVGKRSIQALLLVLLTFGMSAGAQDKPADAPAPAPEQGAAASGGGADTASLAKAAQNPVSSMISLPFQYNLNMGLERYEINKDAIYSRAFLNRWLDEQQGPDGALRLRIRSRILNDWFPGLDKHERTQHILNIQPVYPVTVGSVNLINRAILPVMYQPTGEDDGEFGLGDLQYTMFISPANSGKVIWGVGPAISIPTATDDVLGTGKWSAGPSIVVLTMPGHWVVGALASNLWSFAGDGDRPDVNTMLIQPFLNYNMKKGWYLTSSPIITANWEADSDERWTVPIGGGVGKIFKVGKQPMNASLGAYYNVEKPDGAPDWSLRFQLQFMFPK